MEFTLTNLWGNCARLYAYLNNQGGKAEPKGRDKQSHESCSAKFPIAFKRILTAVGTLDSAVTPYSTHNNDDGISFTNTNVNFVYFSHYYIAIGI